jgi:hypothetical protein
VIEVSPAGYHVGGTTVRSAEELAREIQIRQPSELRMEVSKDASFEQVRDAVVVMHASGFPVAGGLVGDMRDE